MGAGVYKEDCPPLPPDLGGPTAKKMCFSCLPFASRQEKMRRTMSECRNRTLAREAANLVGRALRHGAEALARRWGCCVATWEGVSIPAGRGKGGLTPKIGYLNHYGCV